MTGLIKYAGYWSGMSTQAPSTGLNWFQGWAMMWWEQEPSEIPMSL